MKKAFSLIEISIVMIVIGIIIAAVMSGGDLIKSSETKEFYQQFARKWTTVADTYYDRMGANLTDGSDNNGFNNSRDGYFDGNDMSEDSNQTSLIAQLQSAGVNPCKTIGTNSFFSSGDCNPTQYRIAGEFTDETTVQVYLNAYRLEGIPTNFIVLHNIPADIALAVDRYLDGVPDGTTGNAIAFDFDTDPNNGGLGTFNDNSNMADLDNNLVTYTEVRGEFINLGITVEH